MTTTAPAPAPRKRKRGRETVADMFRSLGLVLIGVVAMWFLAQPPDSDSQEIRVVDPSADIAQLRTAEPGTVAPAGLPAGWRPTSSTLDPEGLRIGYVTPSDQYAEYHALTGESPDLATTTARGRQVGTVVVEGVTYRQFTGEDEQTTLVRDVPGGVVTVGGVRETTTLEEIRALAASLS